METFWDSAGAFHDLLVCATDITYTSDGAEYEIVGAHEQIKNRLRHHYRQGILSKDKYRKAQKSADGCVEEHSGERG